MKKIAMISILLLTTLVFTGCGMFDSQAKKAMDEINNIDKAKAEVDKLGDRYSQGAEARLRAEIEKLKAQIATKSSGHVHVCVLACPPQHNPKPAPIVVQPVVVQPTPVIVQQAPQSTQAPEVCDPCQGREVIIVPCSNWRDCNPPTP